MRSKDLIQPNPFEPNQAMFGGKLRPCTNSMFCSGASFEAKHNIAHKAGVYFKEVEIQALPQQKPEEVMLMNLENYYNLGTGEAYRQLIKDKTLEVVNGHADTVKAF